MTGSTGTIRDSREAKHTHELVDLSGIPLDSPIRELIQKLSSSRFGESAIPQSIMDYERICEHDDAYLCEHRLQWITDFINKNYEQR